MVIDLNGDGWMLSGWTPEYWRMRYSAELREPSSAEIRPFPVSVPGSVQTALRRNGLLPDWNNALNSRFCEWTEHRHWIYTRQITGLPGGKRWILECDGLDYSGWILWDGVEIAAFRGSCRPHRIPLPESADTGNHELGIVFDLPPRWLGQFGRTSQYSIGKPRFYYSWDWMPRLVQTGISGPIRLRDADERRFRLKRFDTTRNSFHIRAIIENGRGTETIRLTLRDGRRIIRSAECTAADLEHGIHWIQLPVEPWRRNGDIAGSPKLYDLTLETEGVNLRLRPGFRSFRRRPCRNAPPGAEPWCFELNGKTFFVQGINWTPLAPDPASVPLEQYRRRIDDYRKMGVNLFRVWGGANREREEFYTLCDEAGILVWQEFPLWSSGMENLPPEDPEAIRELLEIADAYLETLVSHPSLVLWCGGNELFHTGGAGRPCDGSEPALAALGNLIAERDPNRGFVPTSASGPTEYCNAEDYGKGVHHDVHGPWKPSSLPLELDWELYWQQDDALFRSEFGAPGASAPETVQDYFNGDSPWPVSAENPLWRHPFDWWLEFDAFQTEFNRAPKSVTEYISWSQLRQAKALGIAARSARRRFPECGGIIVWMGHDAFPCLTNTSVIDFKGIWKPAAYELQRIFTEIHPKMGENENGNEKFHMERQGAAAR